MKNQTTAGRGALLALALCLLLNALCACFSPTLTVTSGDPSPSVKESLFPSLESSQGGAVFPSDKGEPSELSPVPTPSREPTPTPTPTPTPIPTPTPTPTPEPRVVASMTLLSAGDNLLHTGILRDGMGHARDGEAEDFYFDYIYEHVKEQIAAADFAVINQESIILEKRKIGGKVENFISKSTGGSFVTPSEMMDTLLRIGFDGVDMANNHMLDMGAAGLQWSVQYLDSRGDLLRIGGYLDEAHRKNIPVAEVNGIKVAYLGYTYGTNVPEEIAKKEEGFKFLVPYIDDQQMITELAAANAAADFTVVYIHWGDENVFEPTAEQKRVARLLAENGAGAIIGHHSHCVQPIEYIDDGKGGKVLCAYSLATLISNMPEDQNMLAGFLSFRLDKYDDGSVKLEAPVFTPTVFYYDMSYRSSKIYYLKDMTDALCASHGIGNYPRGYTPKNTMTIERLYKYLQDTIDEGFLPAEYRK